MNTALTVLNRENKVGAKWVVAALSLCALEHVRGSTGDTRKKKDALYLCNEPI